MNFGDLKRHVRKAIADRLSNNNVMTQDDFLIAAFNDVIIPRLVGLRNWHWKEFTETSPLRISEHKMQFPNDLQNLHQLTLITGDRGTTYVLPYVPMRNFFEMYPDPSIEPANFPAMYTWVNRVAWFNCPSSADLALRMVGLRRFQRLVLDSDVPHWMDEDRHMLLVYGAVGYCFYLMEDANMGKTWTDLFDQAVTEWWLQTQGQMDRDFVLGSYQPPSAYGPAAPMLAQYWTNPFVIRSPQVPNQDLLKEEWSGTQDTILYAFVDRNMAIECYEDTEIWLLGPGYGGSEIITGPPPNQPPPVIPPPVIPPPVGTTSSVWHEDVVITIMR